MDLDLSLFGDEHVRRYRETDGEVGYLWNGAPCCVLTTTRKSGDARDTALIFGEADGAYLLVASKGGAPEHPWWYKDLAARPEVELQVKGDRFRGVARTADADEKARLWPVMTALWPSYDDYQAATDRDIPLVVIERAS